MPPRPKSRPNCQLERPSSGRRSAYCPSTQRVKPLPTKGAFTIRKKRAYASSLFVISEATNCGLCALKRATAHRRQHDPQRDLRGLLPLPLMAHAVGSDLLRDELLDHAAGAEHLGRRPEELRRDELLGTLGDVQLVAMPQLLAALAQRREECRYQIARSRLWNADRVHGVAHLAVKRTEERQPKLLGVGGFIGDDPGAARAVEADWHASLARDAAQLLDGAPGSASDSEAQLGMREERPPGGMLRALDEDHAPLGKAGRGEGWFQRVRHDRLGGSGVAADAHHRGVATAEHAGRVGKDAGRPFEHEAHHTQAADTCSTFHPG